MPDDRWNIIEDAFTALCAAYDGGRFAPLLEADVAGYVYYAILAKREGDATCVHLDTRVIGASDNDKYDLVVGGCVSTDERKQAVAKSATLSESMKKLLMSKSTTTGFRPAIRADLIVEFKAFVSGFDQAQLSVHLKQALTDVDKLQALTSLCPQGRAVALFDSIGYLTSSRLDQILARRGAGDTRMPVYIIKPNATREMRWRSL